MADDVKLIIQLPRDSAVDRYFRETPPSSLSSGRVVLEHLPADEQGRILEPPGGEVILSVLSPEAIAREAEQIGRVIKQASAAGEPLVVQLQAAEELRDDELAVIIAAAERARRVVILRVLRSA
jgi:hypothetical protein